MKKVLILIVILLMLFFIFGSFSPGQVSTARAESVTGNPLPSDVSHFSGSS